MTIEHIDLDSLFSDPKIIDFIPDYSRNLDTQVSNHSINEINEVNEIDEIDQAINDALNDINTNHPEPTHYHDLKIEQQKPLSPESLFSESSNSNSPIIFPFDKTNENINLIKKQMIQNNDDVISYNVLKKAYLKKCKEVEMILNELKKSEEKKWGLMEENKYLKSVVVKLGVDTEAMS